MIPLNSLSSTVIASDLLTPDDRTRQPLLDYEMGGIAIADPSEGLQYQPWELSYNALSGDVICTPETTGAPVTLFTIHNITEFSLAFDQNMNVFVTYVVDDDQAWYYWYDPLATTYLHQIMAADVIHPRCTLDDKRPSLVNTSDIILAYQRGQDLYFRQQRDRYTIEYLLAAGAEGRFDKVAMGKNHRLHFEFLTSPSEVVIPPALSKFQQVVNASEQGYIDLSGWSSDTFANFFTPNTLLGANFIQQRDISALTYIAYPDGGTAFGMRIKHIGDCTEAHLLQVNTTNGYISGGVHYYDFVGADTPALPFYAGSNNALLIASDTGLATLEKVDYP